MHEKLKNRQEVLSVYASKIQKSIQKGRKVLLVGSSNCEHLTKSAVGICTKSPKTGKKCCRYMHQKPENPSKRVESAVGICTKLPTPHKKCCRYLHQKSQNPSKRVESAVGNCTKLPTPHKKCCRYMHEKLKNRQEVLSVYASEIQKSIKNVEKCYW